MENHGITRIYTQHWLDLPKEVRNHFSTQLSIVRTGISEVRDNTVVSDGYTNEDLKVITEAKLAEYTGERGTFPELWKKAITKAIKDINKTKELVNEHQVKNQEVSKQEESKVTAAISTGDVGTDTVSTESQPSQGSSSTTLS